MGLLEWLFGHKEERVIYLPESARERIFVDNTCHGLDNLIPAETFVEECHHYEKTDPYGFSTREIEPTFRMLITEKCSVCGKAYKKQEKSISRQEFEQIQRSHKIIDRHTEMEPDPAISLYKTALRPRATTYKIPSPALLNIKYL